MARKREPIQEEYVYSFLKRKILEAQSKSITAKGAAELLYITPYMYKTLCISYGIYKKRTMEEQNKELLGHPCYCWVYDKTKKDSKGEYVGRFQSRKEAGDALGGIQSGSIGYVLDKVHKQAGGYYFEKAY